MASVFIKSATQLSECPPAKLPEVGFVGHSNAGKSSVINALVKQKNLARVSQTPGKTDLLNFYDIDKKFCLVDMPGYGYAARGQEARKTWTPMIEEYLVNRETLKGVVMVMDVQRKWTEDEENLVNWLSEYDLPVVLALNKADKLNQKGMSAKKREFDEISGLLTTVFTSAQTRLGIDQLLRTIFEKLLRS